MSSSLRSFPSLAPPTPKKSPSPRLIPRRSPRRLGPALIGGMGQENNGNHNDSIGVESNAVKKPKPALSQTEQQSLMDSNAKLKRTVPPMLRRRGRKRQQESSAVKSNEPTSSPKQQTLVPVSAASTQSPRSASRSSNESVEEHDPFIFVDDDEFVPMTPKTLDSALQLDGQVTMTPPSQSPPLFVSAKKLGNQVKKQKTYTAKRRRPSDEASAAMENEDDSMKLPEGLSPAQKAREYWKKCYGEKPPQIHPQTSWSARRVAPTKGCLSHSKPKANTTTAHFAVAPTFGAVQSPPLLRHNNGSQGFSTPRTSPDNSNNSHLKCPHSKSVQFGVAEAAEYERDAPAGKFTPLPAEVAQQRFPLTPKPKDDDQGEEEIAETKENSAMLAVWEQDFDSLAEDNYNDKPKKLQGSKRRRSNTKHRRRSSSDRRKSSSFCSPGNGGALYDPTNDEEGTPGNPSLLVMDNLSSEAVQSPSTGVTVGSPEQPKQCDESAVEERSGSLSPVQARRLSSEPLSASKEDAPASETNHIVSQEEDDFDQAEQGTKLRSRLDTTNVWLEALTNSSLLSRRDTNWDLKTVAANLALGSGNRSINGVFNNNNIGPARTISSAWHSCLNGCVQNSLYAATTKTLPTATTTCINDDYSSIDPEFLETWQRLALNEWQKVELEICKNLRRSFAPVKQQISQKSIVLGSVVLPVKASLGPTRKHLSETEKEIQRLEEMIKMEERKKVQMHQRFKMAEQQLQRLQGASSLLSYSAVRQLSSIDVSIAEQCQAIFHHVAQGLETRLELDGSMDVAVSRAVQLDEKQDGDIIDKFYNALLSPARLQEGLILRLSGENGVDDTTEALEMPVLAGRIDLAALSLQEIANEYDVSLTMEEVESKPTLFVRVQLGDKSVLKASYGRHGSSGSAWWVPDTVFCEQDLGERIDLSSVLNQWVRQGSLEATAGFLRAACEEVLQRLAAIE
ncbi:expressed unknown protein [Seminavis robusta]|uniref:Uncharacterized protein n=1 Tax=Seminavis robusta TaxID=568900 RepID=A0A9N8EF72_9STRA|nr:expressed unknown protein [Seminavis robusta]|eukprot:Sro1063_g237140.1 n/a (962) ;mRNA; r:26843-29894